MFTTINCLEAVL